MPEPRARLSCLLLLSALAACSRDAEPLRTAGPEAPVAAAPSRPRAAPMPPPALPALPLARQAEDGVRSHLGNPMACEDVPRGRRCRYAQASTDIVYIDGVADWITVEDLGGAPFSAAALARVGLPTDEDPIETGPDRIRWQNLAGFREVVLHRAPDGRAARLELKTATL